jgi:hypothetical protein
MGSGSLYTQLYVVYDRGGQHVSLHGGS